VWKRGAGQGTVLPSMEVPCLQVKVLRRCKLQRPPALWRVAPGRHSAVRPLAPTGQPRGGIGIPTTTVRAQSPALCWMIYRLTPMDQAYLGRV